MLQFVRMDATDLVAMNSIELNEEEGGELFEIDFESQLYSTFEWSSLGFGPKKSSEYGASRLLKDYAVISISVPFSPPELS